MHKRRKLSYGMEKTIAKCAEKFAGMGANSTCGFFAYQMKEPYAVKKLRKF